MVLDALDQKILRHLEQDARQSNAVIARAVGVSEATVRRRIKNLLQEEALFITALPEPDKFGFHVTALVGITVEAGGMEKVTKNLKDCPEVIFLGSVTGQFDLLAEVVVKDLEDLRAFLGRVSREVREIRETETIAFMKPGSTSRRRFLAVGMPEKGQRAG